MKSYWPQANLAPLGDGMSPDCDEDKFAEFLGDIKPVADRIVGGLERNLELINV